MKARPFHSVVLSAVTGFALVLVLAGPLAAADAPSQCVVCHLDAAKLKPLTPADPPAAEEGEG